MSYVDLEVLNVLVDQGYLRSQHHPTAPLIIFNYTEKTQYERYWTPETLMCRGLIVEEDGRIHSRPFPKFFNLDEWIAMGKEIPNEPFVVTEKMDGSLGISYWIDGVPYLATRGSFTSEQAIRGTEMLCKSGWPLDPKYTYLFEIIYPENRIVVDYGKEERLVLLAFIDTETGYDYIPNYAWEDKNVVPTLVAATFPSALSLIDPGDPNNREGYVIKFQSGLRLKVKFDEYKRLHKLVFGVNAQTIWECLKDGTPLSSMLERVPDEFYQWVNNQATLLSTQYWELRGEADKLYEEVKDFTTRKEQALFVLNSTSRQVAPCVFALLGGKDPAPIIWKMLKPKADKPFRMGEE